MRQITINNIAFDPAVDGPALTAAGPLSPDSARSEYVRTEPHITLRRTAGRAGTG
jgi:hypothetical protein